MLKRKRTVICSIILLLLIFLAVIFIKFTIFNKNENLNTENIATLLIFEAQDGIEVENILTAKESELYTYNIKSYGGSAYVKLSNGKKITMRKALLNNIINMDFIIKKADEDMENGKIEPVMYQDGGSKEYRYNDFTIIKLNQLNLNREGPMNFNTDVYICSSKTTIKDLK